MLSLIKKIILSLVLIGAAAILFFIFFNKREFINPGVGAVSVSSDGRYAITTDHTEKAILWDLQKHTSKILDRKSHVFSAYFIPGTQDYLWQDKSRSIHIRNTLNNTHSDFKIPTFIFSQAMTSDRNNYLVGDMQGHVYLLKNGNWHSDFQPEENKNQNEDLDSMDAFRLMIMRGMTSHYGKFTAGKNWQEWTNSNIEVFYELQQTFIRGNYDNLLVRHTIGFLVSPPDFIYDNYKKVFEFYELYDLNNLLRGKLQLKNSVNYSEEAKRTIDKPYNLSMSLDQKYILSIYSLADFKLWDLNDKNNTYSDTEYKTRYSDDKASATLSPDGKYVIGGDESGDAFLWQAKTGKKLFKLYGINWGQSDIVCQNDKNDPEYDTLKCHRLDSPKIFTTLPPDDFISRDGETKTESTLSIKFIDATHYLRFIEKIPYAILYEVTNPAPLKYFPLGRSPWPAIDYYGRNQAIDTSWQSHTLVIGKDTGEGILVYQYDPEKQTLTKVWNGRSCFLVCRF